MPRTLFNNKFNKFTLIVEILIIKQLNVEKIHDVEGKITDTKCNNTMSNIHNSEQNFTHLNMSSQNKMIKQ